MITVYVQPYEINQCDVIKQIDQNTVILQNQIDKLEERLVDTPAEAELNVGYQ